MARRRGDGWPADLVRARQRFASWRYRRVRGTRIPPPLWKLAVDLADAHGVHRTASALSLDYYALKRRHQQADGGHASGNSSFVELAPRLAPTAAECVVELGDGMGNSMRVHLKGGDTLDVVALARSFWVAE